MELMGIIAIGAVLTGSVLVALFVGEALITSIIRMMSGGLRRADETAARLASQPQAAKLITGQRPRLQRI